MIASKCGIQHIYQAKEEGEVPRRLFIGEFIVGEWNSQEWNWLVNRKSKTTIEQLIATASVSGSEKQVKYRILFAYMNQSK